MLSEEERGRAEGFVRTDDRTRYVAAHIALRQLLGAQLGIAPAAVEFGREPCPCCGRLHGRPVMHGARLHFSLSHSGDAALFAFAGVPVGVDIETMPSAATVSDITVTLHPREQEEIAALPDEMRRSAFARCWTRKEAYLKGTGIGLARGPEQPYVGAGTVPATLPGWLVDDVSVPTGYVAACVVKGH